jgi:hypothetical protein
MTDIVKQLREGPSVGPCAWNRWKAADEIERLRAERDAAKLQAAEAVVALNNRDRERMQAEREARAAGAERDRLRAEVEAARRDEREANAALIDCGCDNRDAVLARLESKGERYAAYLCQQGSACCALQAATIRARGDA